MSILDKFFNIFVKEQKTITEQLTAAKQKSDDNLNKSLDAFKAIFEKHGIDPKTTSFAESSLEKAYDNEWRNDAKIIKEMILREGVTNTLGAFVDALNFIEADRGHEDGEEFYESQEYKNLQHCQQVIDIVMTACDLDITYGYGEARKVSLERFEENIKELEKLNIFKEQA